jgi:putative serine protease PepD
MIHQPPLQPPEDPQQPPDVTQRIAPLGDGQTRAQRRDPAYPPVSLQTPSEPRPAALLQSRVEPAQPAKPRRLVELVAVAALAAILAAILSSAGTYALTRGDVGASPPAQTQSAQAPTGGIVSQAPVVQANASAPDWSVTAARVSPSVVAISVQGGQTNGQGSGVIYDTKGDILTNNHVVASGGQGSKLSVTLNDKRAYDATIVGTDPSSDLAVIKLTGAPNDLKAIALGDNNNLKVGDPVMAVGNPLGLAGTVTTGIVSALNRPVTTSAQAPADPSAGEPVVTNAVQTSAAINPGNSGGALVNAGGQLVGINSSIAGLGSSGGSSAQGGNIGIGFAIPVDEARSVADQLIKSGKATHAFLGISSKDDFVTERSARRAASVITNVASGAPADKAGVKAGDAIIAVNGEPVDSALSLVAKVHERAVGDRVTLKVLHDGQIREVSLTLTSKPAPNQ